MAVPCHSRGPDLAPVAPAASLDVLTTFNSVPRGGPRPPRDQHRREVHHMGHLFRGRTSRRVKSVMSPLANSAAAIGRRS